MRKFFGYTLVGIGFIIMFLGEEVMRFITRYSYFFGREINIINFFTDISSQLIVTVIGILIMGLGAFVGKIK